MTTVANSAKCTALTLCPADLPLGYFWYGRKHCCPGNPPRWIESLFDPRSSKEAGKSNAVDDSERDSEGTLFTAGCTAEQGGQMDIPSENTIQSGSDSLNDEDALNPSQEANGLQDPQEKTNESGSSPRQKVDTGSKTAVRNEDENLNVNNKPTPVKTPC